MRDHTIPCLVILVLLSGPGSPTQADEITFPAQGQCLGWPSVPVAIEDTFDPSSARSLNPEPPPAQPRQRKLQAAEPSASATFGRVVSFDGDRLLISAHQSTEGFSAAGAVHVFERDGAGWRERNKLTAPRGTRFGWFGRAMAADADTLAIAARNTPSHRMNEGAVYVFGRYGDAWVPQQFLLAAEPAPGGNFGTGVDVVGDVMCIGEPAVDSRGRLSGRAHVFRLVAGSWVEEQQLVGSLVAAGSRFGTSCSTDGERIAIGAPTANPGNSGGRSYIFVHDGTRWVEEAAIEAPLSFIGDAFGHSLALSGDTLVVGAPVNSGGVTARAYVFERIGEHWIETGSFESSFLTSHLGYSVALDGDTVVVGTLGDAPGFPAPNVGSTYHYRRHQGQWLEQSRWTANDAGAEQDWFGHSVAIRGDTAVIGAPLTGEAGFATGSAYVMEGPPLQGYRRHGDHSVELTVDGGGDSVAFTIDLKSPKVEVFTDLGELILPVTIPLGEVFASTDDDGATGGVVQERILWGECPLLDGATYGNGDGLLSDETLIVDAATLCNLLSGCDEPGDRRLRIEAVDCGGNAGVVTLPSALKPALANCPE